MSWKGIKKDVVNWHKGLLNTTQFWNPKRVKKGVQQQWSIKADPLGRRLSRMYFGTGQSTPSSGNSAVSYSTIPGTSFRRYT